MWVRGMKLKSGWTTVAPWSISYLNLTNRCIPLFQSVEGVKSGTNKAGECRACFGYIVGSSDNRPAVRKKRKFKAFDRKTYQKLIQNHFPAFFKFLGQLLKIQFLVVERT